MISRSCHAGAYLIQPSALDALDRFTDTKQNPLCCIGCHGGEEDHVFITISHIFCKQRERLVPRIIPCVYMSTYFPKRRSLGIGRPMVSIVRRRKVAGQTIDKFLRSMVGEMLGKFR